jgi:hypothetical protein
MSTQLGSTAYVSATGKHLFWTRNRGWQHASELNSNDTLLDAQGNDVHIVSIEDERRMTATYNLAIDKQHTYL